MNRKMRSTSSQLKNYKGWMVWIFLLGLLLRLFQLGEWSFWHDEGLTVLLARHPVGQLISISATSDMHPPLYFLVVKLFMWLGQSETIVRLPGALSGAVSVLALYWLGRDLFDKRVGQVGALIMALSPLQIFYAQEARMYAQMLLLILLSNWCLVRALRQDHLRGSSVEGVQTVRVSETLRVFPAPFLSMSQLRWWAGFTISATLAGYTAYIAFPAFVAMGLYVLLIDRRRRHILHFLLAGGAAGLLYLPWVGFFLRQTRAIMDSFWMVTPNPLTLFTTVSAFFIGYSLPPVWIAVSLATTLLIIFVVLNDVRHALAEGEADTRPLVWLLLWAFVPLLGIFLVSLVRPIFEVRTVITAAPAFYLLVAWGVTHVRNKKLNLLLFLPTLAMMIISIANFYFNPAFAKPAWRLAANYVNEHTRPGDVVLHTSDGSLLPFLAYQPNRPHILLPVDPEVFRLSIPSQVIATALRGPPQPIDRAVKGYERAWLVVGLDFAVEHQLEQQRQLDQRYRLLAEKEIEGIYIFTYALHK